MTPRTATLIGLTAILMWSLLSVLTVATGKMPRVSARRDDVRDRRRGRRSRPGSGGPRRSRALRQPPIAWVVGVGGLFGYHALYFLALRFAPPAEAAC